MFETIYCFERESYRHQKEREKNCWTRQQSFQVLIFVIKQYKFSELNLWNSVILRCSQWSVPRLFCFQYFSFCQSLQKNVGSVSRLFVQYVNGNSPILLFKPRENIWEENLTHLRMGVAWKVSNMLCVELIMAFQGTLAVVSEKKLLWNHHALTQTIFNALTISFLM